MLLQSGLGNFGEAHAIISDVLNIKKNYVVKFV